MSRKTKRAIVGLLFALPSIVGFMIFFGVPFIIGILYSFIQDTNTFKFVGLENYADLFASPSFILAMVNILRFTAIAVPLLILLSLGTALIFDFLYNSKAPYVSALFTSNIASMAVPSAVIVLLIQILFERYGVINNLLTSEGLPPVDWLRSEYVFYILIALYLWRNCSYCMIIFLTGLRQINGSIYEAASLDGANGVQRFVYMTAPHMVPSLFFVVIMGISGVFKIFRESYLLLGDYPNEKAYMLQNFMNNNFVNLNYKRLSAASLVFFVIISLMVLVMLKLNYKESEWH